MFKKILLVSAINAGIASAAMANPVPYVGGNTGIVTNTSSSVAIGSMTTSGVGGHTTIFSQPGNYRGVPFNLFAGYGGVINQNFFLAGEVFGTVGTADISNNNQMKTSYGYGASVLPGLMLCDNTVAYVRAGVVRSRFTNDSVTRTGGQVGLGLQTTLTQNIDLRGEYDFTGYRSFSNVIGNVSSPRQDAFNLGVVYKFD